METSFTSATSRKRHGGMSVVSPIASTSPSAPLFVRPAPSSSYDSRSWAWGDGGAKTTTNGTASPTVTSPNATTTSAATSPKVVTVRSVRESSTDPDDYADGAAEGGMDFLPPCVVRGHNE